MSGWNEFLLLGRNRSTLLLHFKRTKQGGSGIQPGCLLDACLGKCSGHVHLREETQRHTQITLTDIILLCWFGN